MTKCGGTAEQGSFSEEASGALLAVRVAVGQLLDACAVPPQTVQRSHKRLQIDKNLAWRLAKVLQEEDLHAAARHMPGLNAMRALFAFAEGQQVPPQLISEVRDSLEAFGRLVEDRAGNRKTFELMLSAQSSSPEEDTDAVYRKEATIAQSYLWGVIAQAQIRANIVRPSAKPGFLDVAAIGGFVGLRWIRPGTGWVVSRTRCMSDDGAALRQPVGEPIDPAISPGAVPLLREYCSPNLPRLRRSEVEHGFVTDELVTDEVGVASSATVMTGELYRALVRSTRDEHNRTGSYVQRARTPCEALLFDVLLHKDLLRRDPPTLSVFGDMEYGSEMAPTAARQRNRIMQWQKLASLGKGVAAAYTPHFARYTQMLASTMARLGWNPEEFSVFRVEIPYPILPSSVAVQCELPDQ